MAFLMRQQHKSVSRDIVDGGFLVDDSFTELLNFTAVRSTCVGEYHTIKITSSLAEQQAVAIRKYVFYVGYKM